MSTRNLLRHIFRHGPRNNVSEDAMPLGLGTSHKKLAGISVDSSHEPKALHNHQNLTMDKLTPPPKTPEPFGLENIAEEDGAGTLSLLDTASLTETPTSVDLDISTFSTSELVHATLNEAKMATNSHLNTIDTTLALLEALDGFSATISALKKEMLEEKQACEEKMEMLDAIERALWGMVFAGEAQEQDSMTGFGN
jgi:hypothetical protein